MLGQALSNWTVKTYTAATWTDLVKGPAELCTVIIANTTAAPIVVAVQLVNGAKSCKSVLVPGYEVKASDSVSLDIERLEVGPDDTVQVKAAAVGINFTGSGEKR